ncbi:MAG: MerR family transcriptional regulator [Candidatus Omnitrophica bacterium]|nr:MerR family transcriptional regulator [Candidatus Omnitrophota bacterium]
MTKRFYSTREVLKKIGISRNTLFLWFKNKKIPEVARDRNGHRVFSNKDIKVILAYKNRIVPPKE